MRREILRSRNGLTRAMLIAAALLGSVIFQTAYSTESAARPLAALILGAGLVLVASGMFLLNPSTTLAQEGSSLIITRRNIFGSRDSRYALRAVDGLTVARQGRGGSPAGFQIYVVMKNGSRLPTGHWGYNEAGIIERAGNAAAALGVPLTGGPALGPAAATGGALPVGISNVYLWSAALALGGYALIFRALVGPWCRAMWHGTFPLLVVPILFCSSLQLLQRINRLRAQREDPPK